VNNQWLFVGVCLYFCAGMFAFDKQTLFSIPLNDTVSEGVLSENWQL